MLYGFSLVKIQNMHREEEAELRLVTQKKKHKFCLVLFIVDFFVVWKFRIDTFGDSSIGLFIL